MSVATDIKAMVPITWMAAKNVMTVIILMEMGVQARAGLSTGMNVLTGADSVTRSAEMEL